MRKQGRVLVVWRSASGVMVSFSSSCGTPGISDGVVSSVTFSVLVSPMACPLASMAMARMRLRPQVRFTLWAVKMPRASVVIVPLALTRSPGSIWPLLLRSLYNQTVLLGVRRPEMLTTLLLVMRSSGQLLSLLVVLIHSVFS